ncbi:MAG: phage head closure protein [Paracoccus sp. (in: a-proteobacteria)]|nr:phage head closure protein [Paracoccus sp. (in: a-proteobacteria)]
MDAGKLDRRVLFQSKRRVETPAGGWTDGWTDEFTVWAQVKPLRGGETVMQARMAAKNPVIVIVRASSQTRRIEHNWRVMIDGSPYEIRETPRLREARDGFEMLAEG